MYFYDPKTNKHFCLTDQQKFQIVCWSDKGITNHVRIVKTVKIRQLFDALPICYSKIIYDPETELPWVQYEGASGYTCKDLENFIKEFDVRDVDEYAIAYKRYARNAIAFSLPKCMALSEYTTIQGYGLSKAMVNVHSLQVITAEGAQQEQCIDWIRMHLA